MTFYQNTKNIQDLEQQTIQLVTELIKQLKAQDLWQKDTPTLSQLTSTAPFCCDTLALEQWLQFIFIPKIQLMIANHQPLPENIALKPMAEEVFKYLNFNGTALIDVLSEIDQLLTAPRQ
tara:strand:- start:27 stop:386 length:360 start_codon:yes stop_codon:yes gene_type:complete